MVVGWGGMVAVVVRRYRATGEVRNMRDYDYDDMVFRLTDYARACSWADGPAVFGPDMETVVSGLTAGEAARLAEALHLVGVMDGWRAPDGVDALADLLRAADRRLAVSVMAENAAVIVGAYARGDEYWMDVPRSHLGAYRDVMHACRDWAISCGGIVAEIPLTLPMVTEAMNRVWDRLGVPPVPEHLDDDMADAPAVVPLELWPDVIADEFVRAALLVCALDRVRETGGAS